MRHVAVLSSDVQSVGYDPASQTLEIAFHSGGLYQYMGVPESVYRALISASSHGRFFHAFIKDRYLTHRLS